MCGGRLVWWMSDEVDVIQSSAGNFRQISLSLMTQIVPHKNDSSLLRQYKPNWYISQESLLIATIILMQLNGAHTTHTSHVTVIIQQGVPTYPGEDVLVHLYPIDRSVRSLVPMLSAYTWRTCTLPKCVHSG